MERVTILGGGPAGCTAALYLARAKIEPLVLEGALSKEILPGGQLMTTTDIENFPGFPDSISGAELMMNMKKQAQRFGARFESKTASAVDLTSDPKIITAGGDMIETRAVIIATGATARYLGLESEERFMNRGVSACATCDGALPRFREQPVVVVGGGDSAMEEALFLANFASRVHVIHRREELRASKIMADRVLSHDKITVEWNSVVDEVVGDDENGVTGVRLKDTKSDATREVACTGYFVAIGHTPNTALFADVLEMDESGYLLTKPDTSYTDVPGVFAAGDVADKVYRQAITAAGTGCRAALDCTRWLEAHENM